MQSGAQPSSAVVLPSSHSSPGSTRPFPQTPALELEEEEEDEDTEELVHSKHGSASVSLQAMLFCAQMALPTFAQNVPSQVRLTLEEEEFTHWKHGM